MWCTRALAPPHRSRGVLGAISDKHVAHTAVLREVWADMFQALSLCGVLSVRCSAGLLRLTPLGPSEVLVIASWTEPQIRVASNPGKQEDLEKVTPLYAKRSLTRLECPGERWGGFEPHADKADSLLIRSSDRMITYDRSTISIRLGGG